MSKIILGIVTHEEVINNKTKIPLYEILEDTPKTIKTIENNLKKEVIGQDDAINKLIKITKKIKLGYIY